jgi:hypothetical protein
MDPKAMTPHFHDLKRLARSPAHYLAGLGVESEDTAAFRFGRLVHALTLGGPVHVFEGARRAGKEWEAFAAAHNERDIYKRDEVDAARRVSDAVKAHPIASKFLDGAHEVPAVWSMYGRKVATRGIDICNPRFICDLKTTSNAEPYTFQRGALRYAYHAQCAMYVDAARDMNLDVQHAFVIAVETAAPYAITVHQLTPRMLEEGRKLVRSWIERLRACEEANEWPGYVQSIVDWDVVEEAGLIIDGEEIAA